MYNPYADLRAENIQYTTPIETIRRKFALKKDKAGVQQIKKDTKKTSVFFGGAQRHGLAAGLGEYRLNYVYFKKNARSTAPSTDELALRETFAVVSRGVQVIMHDLSQITRTQQMWQTALQHPNDKTINGVRAFGYTYPGWIFAVQYAGRKESGSYNVNTFPNAFDA